MSSYVLFQMLEPFRQSLIAGHRFYVEQARKRLLSQFDDIEKEAGRASEEWLEQHGHRFDPDRHDPGEFYEAANDAGIEFYQLLKGMQERTHLSVVAGMYHEWDKQLREWMTKEISRWNGGSRVATNIWSVDFGKLIDLLESFGWNVRSKEYFKTLDACRLVINIYKHGEGNSLNDLKKNYPEYLSDPLKDLGISFSGFDFLDHSNLSVSEEQLQKFSEAIVAFWKDVPESINDRGDISVPSWFDKALKSDQKSS